MLGVGAISTSNVREFVNTGTTTSYCFVNHESLFLYGIFASSCMTLKEC